MSASALVPAASASAQDYRGDYRQGGYNDRDYRGGEYDRGYDRGDNRGDYRGPYRGGYRSDGGYYNNDYRDNGYNQRRVYYRNQRCSDGTAGTIIGAIAGGLLGNSIAGYGNRGTGTIIGGAAGALAGRAIDKGGCRR
ncbi:MAG: glycine zipper 2TM domain-containing protein [Sphingomonas sp.]